MLPKSVLQVRSYCIIYDVFLSITNTKNTLWCQNAGTAEWRTSSDNVTCLCKTEYSMGTFTVHCLIRQRLVATSQLGVVWYCGSVGSVCICYCFKV